MIIAKSKQMQSIDKMAIESYQIPGILLMEHAAIEVVKELPKSLMNGMVVCSTGNNGGDGLAVARLLFHQGKDVRVIMIGDAYNIKPDAKIMYDSVVQLGIHVEWFEEDTIAVINSFMMDSDFIVDAIFGIGCDRVIKGDYHSLISSINNSEAYVVSVDMPSGINSDNGKMMGGINVKADVTVTFTLPKIGNLLYPGGALASKQLKIVDIGIPQKVLEAFEYAYETLDESTLRLLPKRNPIAHKMNYGRLLVIAGSKGMSGAAYLAAKSATE